MEKHSALFSEAFVLNIMSLMRNSVTLVSIMAARTSETQKIEPFQRR